MARRVTSIENSTCHPTRPHHAEGLCIGCYRKAWRKRRIPSCHPDRSYAAKGLCHACYASGVGMETEGWGQQPGRALDRLGVTLPPRWRNLEQRVIVVDVALIDWQHPEQSLQRQIPTICRKCRSDSLRHTGREVRCLACGSTQYLVSSQGVAYAPPEVGQRSPKVGRPPKYADRLPALADTG